jgi:hypothetical protein
MDNKETKELWLLGGDCEPAVVRATECGIKGYLEKIMREELYAIKEHGGICSDPDNLEVERKGNNCFFVSAYSHSDGSSTSLSWCYEATRIDNCFVLEVDDVGDVVSKN